MSAMGQALSCTGFSAMRQSRPCCGRLGLLSVRALGTTRDAEVKPGDRICEAGIYREWRREEDRALGEESFVEVRARRGCTRSEGADRAEVTEREEVATS